MSANERWGDRLPRPGYVSLPRVPVSHDWFEVYRVDEGACAIYEPFPSREVISCLAVDSELQSDRGR